MRDWLTTAGKVGSGQPGASHSFWGSLSCFNSITPFLRQPISVRQQQGEDLGAWPFSLMGSFSYSFLLDQLGLGDSQLALDSTFPFAQLCLLSQGRVPNEQLTLPFQHLLLENST